MDGFPYGEDEHWSCGEAEHRVRKQMPGSLSRLYYGVVDYLERGENVPNETMLLLLKEMGPPKLTSKQQQKLDMFRWIEVIQMFAGVPDRPGGPLIENAPDSFRAACNRAIELLKNRDREDLKSYEKQVLAGDPEEFYKAMMAIKKGSRRIK